MKRFLALLCASGLCLLNCWPSAIRAAEPSGAIRGRVVDASDGSGLPEATIAVLGADFGAYSDEDGRFELEGLPAGEYDLLISFIGYRAAVLRQVATGGEALEVALEPTAIEMPDLVISATRRLQSFAEAPVSVAVADARKIATHNALSLSGPLAEVPGVSLIGGQVNIRGSSGYSRGTGSRVLLLMDGMPLLAADLGDVKWDLIPVDQVARVEVIKGAGSALYGTGALGGVINVITRQPDETPTTRFRLLGGLYGQPEYQSWEWTDGLMYRSGIDVSHSRTIGSTGLVFSGGHQRGTGYHENDDFDRYRLFGKVFHRFSPSSYWRTTAAWSVDDHGVFVQWKDRSQPLMVPAGDRGASTVSWKFNLNSELYRLHRRDLGFRLKTSYYRTGFDNSRQAGDLNSAGHKLSAEFQTDYTGWEDFSLILGTSSTFDLVRSPGDFLGERSVVNLALFGQGVRQFGPQLELALGMRYDWHRRSGGETGSADGLCPYGEGVPVSRQAQFSPQVGLSYRPYPETALRASAGRGFRAPSVSEIYSQALVSGLMVCPNPELEAERSWSYEMGVNQRIGELMVVDLALFWDKYDGLIEGRADPEIGGAVPVARFRNLAKARVRGLEIEQRMALPFGLRWQAAYTYLDAVEFLAEDEVLPPYCHEEYVPGKEAPLPYRSKHLLNLGLGGGWGKVKGGVNFQYMSRFDRVSGLFPECDRDMLPVYLVDGFAGCRMGSLQFNLRVDNLLQYHYILTERKIRPTRQVSLTVAGEL